MLVQRHSTLSERVASVWGVRICACIALLCLVLACPSEAFAKKVSSKKAKAPSTLLQADDISYDQKAKTIMASGHVEVAYDRQVLHADRVVYHQDTGVVRAEGNVRIKQSSGDVLFAKESELTSDMAQGFIEQVGILFSDGSRLAAADAQRYEGRYLVADRGLYTACNVCTNDPSKPPLWQIKAKRITDDNVKKDVIYRDATVEFDGLPVFY